MQPISSTTTRSIPVNRVITAQNLDRFALAEEVICSTTPRMKSQPWNPEDVEKKNPNLSVAASSGEKTRRKKIERVASEQRIIPGNPKSSPDPERDKIHAPSLEGTSTTRTKRPVSLALKKNTPLKQPASCEEKWLCVKEFAPGFDAERPIQGVVGRDIARSFCGFLACADYERQGFFIVNGRERVPPPIDCLPEKKKQDTFFRWLIKTLNFPLAQETSLSSKKQAKRLLSEKSALKDDLTLQVQKFLQEVGADARIGVKALLTQKADFLPAFHAWLSAKVREQGFYDQIEGMSTVRVGALLVNLFMDTHQIPTLQKKIPCFRILQALSFNAFAAGAVAMDALFNAKPEKSPIKVGLDPKVLTQYSISCDRDQEQFCVTHVKTYQIMGRDVSQRFTRPLGHLTVRWTLKGPMHQEGLSATLEVGAVQWSEKLSRKEKNHMQAVINNASKLKHEPILKVALSRSISN